MLQMTKLRIIIKSGPYDFQVFQHDYIYVVIHLIVHLSLRWRLNEWKRPPWFRTPYEWLSCPKVHFIRVWGVILNTAI